MVKSAGLHLIPIWNAELAQGLVNTLWGFENLIQILIHVRLDYAFEACMLAERLLLEVLLHGTLLSRRRCRTLQQGLFQQIADAVVHLHEQVLLVDGFAKMRRSKGRRVGHAVRSPCLCL